MFCNFANTNNMDRDLINEYHSLYNTSGKDLEKNLEKLIEAKDRKLKEKVNHRIDSLNSND